ncbi:MAG: phenylalanine--tRNA ligase subunit alpha [Candidatus Nanohaloarchaeota archaeon QJJ-5]|nr:phenylalanine--tRNA ligase subunit alpha [Candidatus Nanohaloarchaeota archaeon QJJ-5]
MELHPKAEHLLHLIDKHGDAVRVDVIEDEEDMDHSAVMRPAQWLVDAQMIEIKDGSTITYELTADGEHAYINGLPEKRLLDLLEDSDMTMDEARDQIGPFDIAMGQCKKNGWIEIGKDEDKNYLYITEDGRSKLADGFAIEDTLEEIADTNETSQDNVDTLIERGLVTEEQDTWSVLHLTEKGEKRLERLAEQREQEAERLETQIGDLDAETIRSGEWKSRGFRKYDVEADVETTMPGKRHPYRQYLDEVRKRFLSMGFQEAKTDLVEMEFWNFDVLFQAQDHPAREIHDKFELENPSHGDLMHDEIVERVKKMHEGGWDIESTGWDYQWNRQKASQLMLRSQTTATTIRYLAEGLESPAKVFAIDRNFRYDEIDKTHFIEFYQAEGIVKAPDLSLRDLFGYLKLFGEEIADAKKIRFRPGYFPFTEPSVELDAYHPELGWVELGGAGLFRPEVRAPLDVDDPVIAWGMGIDRLAMFKLDEDDLRELVFPQDIERLKNTPAVIME